MNRPPLILASSSPARRQLMERLKVPFEAISPEVDESARPGEPPEALVLRLAEAKARAVAEHRPDALVIGSDQVAVMEGEIVGKPGSHERALEQLRAASGNRITFHTGLCLFNAGTGSLQLDRVPCTVWFRRLTPRQMENYLRKEQPYGCAGSFKSEGLGVTLIERLEGEDPNALIGLPLIRLVKMLEREGFDLLEE